MPEEQSVQGTRWTIHAVELLKGLGWSPRGDINVDIPCTIHPNRRNPHGIDAFLTYSDPYRKKEIGIIIETKNYAWRSVTRAFIQETVDNLIETIECAPLSDEFQRRLNFSNAAVNTGLILIWSHDDFERDTFQRYLKELEIPKKRKLSTIYVLNNYDILKLYSLYHTIKQICSSLREPDKFDIYYPSYSNSDSVNGKNFVNLEYFTSKFIFGKMIESINYKNKSRDINTITTVFYFDQLNLESLNYLYLSLKKFQLADDKIRIYHYNDPSHYRGPIREFVRICEEEHGKKVEFLPMLQLDDVPWRVV